MAFPTTSHTSTSLDSFIPEIWGEKINEFFRAKLVTAPFFTDRSDEVSEGGDVLYTPSVTELTASAKSNATAVTLFGGLIIRLKQSIMSVYDSKEHSHYTLSFVQ
jgi:hypothetical protein